MDRLSRSIITTEQVSRVDIEFVVSEDIENSDIDLTSKLRAPKQGADIQKKDDAGRTRTTVNATSLEIEAMAQEELPTSQPMQPTDQNKTSPFCKHYFATTVLSLLIVMVSLLFSLPTVFYALNVQKASEVTKLPIIKNSTESRKTRCDVSQASQIKNTSETQCISQIYTHNVCHSQLHAWQECFLERKGLDEILIPSDIDQEEVEGNARSLLEIFVNSSLECETAFKSFICMYLFGLCDTDHQIYQALQADCVRVRDDICSREWNFAVELLQTRPDIGYGSLPHCEDLSNVTSSCQNDVDNEMGIKTSGFMEDVAICETTNITACSEGFYLLNESSCRPECGNWTHPDYNILSNKVLEKWIVITCVVIALAASAVFVLIATTCQRKVILVYPSTYLVYIMLMSFILALTIFISATTDEKSLFCRSRDLLETFENGTPFCAFAGIVYYYSIFQITMWLLFHSGALFWAIIFPFHYRQWKNEGRVKYVHITTVILALLVPTIAPITTLLKDGYASFSSPTYFCLGKNSDVLYATLVLPISIFAAIASSLLIIIFWTILKQFTIKKTSKRKANISVGKAEVKIMVILCFYILMGIFVLIGLTNTTSLRDYFLCESSDREDCDSLPTLNFPVLGHLQVVSNILQGLVPVIVLLFSVSTCTCTRRVKVKRLSGKRSVQTSHFWRGKSAIRVFQLC